VTLVGMRAAFPCNLAPASSLSPNRIESCHLNHRLSRLPPFQPLRRATRERHIGASFGFAMPPLLKKHRSNDVAICLRVAAVCADRVPSIASAVFVGIAVLRNARAEAVGVLQCNSQSDWRTVIDHVDCEALDVSNFGESRDHTRNVFERMR
jgi:hypothetical protein